jgi:signal transduction histidine kinase
LTVRRLERDLHDGAQTRIVALGLLLERAEKWHRRGDEERVATLLSESREETWEVVRELRRLVQGIVPPALDEGLHQALAVLAERSPMPTVVTVVLAQRPAASVETVVYFSAAELLSNVAKHSGARTASVTVTETGRRIRLSVADDGHGGASLDPVRGSGLRGLAERIRAADGTMEISSPRGGPTRIAIDLPER